MKKSLFSFFVIILLLVSGCQAATRSSAPMEQEMAPAAAGIADVDYRFSEEAGGSAANTQPGADRLVIRNADLVIVVANPGESAAVIGRMAEEMGGFVVSSRTYKTYSERNAEATEASITIRVPAESLNKALDEIKALVEDPEEDVISENVSGQDVTKEYTDLRSQLTNLEEAEKQLREIMGSATKTEDVLAVHQQLTQVRERIEVIKGQMQYYEESAAFSAISVQVRAEESLQPLEIGGWRPVGVALDAIQALIDTVKVLGNIAIWLILYVLPVALIIGLPIWLFVRFIRGKRRTGGKKPPALPAEPEQAQ